MGRTLKDVLETQAPEKNTTGANEVDASSVANVSANQYSGYGNKLNGTDEQRARDLYSIASMLAQEQAKQSSSDNRRFFNRPTSRKNLRESTERIYNTMKSGTNIDEDWTADRVLGETNPFLRDISEGMDSLGGIVGTGVDWAFDNTIGALAGAIGGDKAGEAVTNWMTGDDLSWLPWAALDTAAIVGTGGLAAPVVAARNALEYRNAFRGANTGIDQITGQELSDRERTINNLSGLLGVGLSALPGGAATRGLGKVAAKASGEAGVSAAKELAEKAATETAAKKSAYDEAIKNIRGMDEFKGLSDSEFKTLFPDDGQLNTKELKKLVDSERSSNKALKDAYDTSVQDHIISSQEYADKVQEADRILDEMNARRVAGETIKGKDLKVYKDQLDALGVDTSGIKADDFVSKTKQSLRSGGPDSPTAPVYAQKYSDINAGLKTRGKNKLYGSGVPAQELADARAAETLAKQGITDAEARAAAAMGRFDSFAPRDVFGVRPTVRGMKRAFSDSPIAQAGQTPINGDFLHGGIPRFKNVVNALTGRDAMKAYRKDLNLAKQLENGVKMSDEELKAAQEAASRIESASKGSSLARYGGNVGAALLQNSANLGNDSENIFEDAWNLAQTPEGWGALAELGLISLIGRRPGFKPGALASRGISPAARYGMQGDMFMRAMREANPGLDDDALLELYYMLAGSNGTPMSPQDAKKAAQKYRDSRGASSEKEGEE